MLSVSVADLLLALLNRKVFSVRDGAEVELSFPMRVHSAKISCAFFQSFFQFVLLTLEHETCIFDAPPHTQFSLRHKGRDEINIPPEMTMTDSIIWNICVLYE